MLLIHNCIFAACAAASRARGGTSPPLANHPRRGCWRVPATANKFVHILWKNLICDNVAEARFYARPRGRECWRCEALACCFREGDAPAGCSASAGCAPLQGDAAFGAPKSWPRPVWRAEVVAPYEIARQFTFSRPTEYGRHAAQATISARDGQAHTAHSDIISPGAHCAPLRQSAFALPCTPGAFVTGSPPRKATVPHMRPTACASRRAGTA